MTTKELYEILEHEINIGRGNYKVMVWDLTREEATDTIRDSTEKKFYICTDD